jgi:hypothetical protein
MYVCAPSTSVPNTAALTGVCAYDVFKIKVLVLQGNDDGVRKGGRVCTKHIRTCASPCVRVCICVHVCACGQLCDIGDTMV